MKTVFLPTALCASLALTGCVQTKQPGDAESRGSTAQTSQPKMAKPAAAGTPATTNSAPPPGTYGKRETYPHASSSVSTSALIAGGATSGGPAVAPSATAIEGRLQEWHLSPADIAGEIASGRPIVRTKVASGDSAVEAMPDEELLTLVNNRLVADPDTGRVTTQLKIAHGEIIIRGSAASAGLIGRAIAVALDTKGVTKVTSELRIDPRLPPALRDDPSKVEPASTK